MTTRPKVEIDDFGIILVDGTVQGEIIPLGVVGTDQTVYLVDYKNFDGEEYYEAFATEEEARAGAIEMLEADLNEEANR